jgi:hypothetical protein
VKRVIALGASNLTRGLRTVASLSRVAWGPETEVIAALGLGRSYGAAQRLVVRSLPGILQCGIWRALEALPPALSIGIVADIGNDILYGYPPDRILEWVGEAVTRLQQHTREIALTGLPFHNIDRLSERQFRLMRTFMFPSSRQTLAGAREGAIIVQAGLERMATDRGLRFVRLQPEWYGWDPIHFRPRCWRRVWGEFLGLDTRASSAAPEPGGLAEAARLWLRADEHRWLFGIHQYTPQHGRLQLY